MHLALIAESDERCDLGRPDTAPEQDARARDPRLRQERIRRESNLPGEGPAQMELVGTRVVRKGVERHVVGDVIEEELARAANARSEACLLYTSDAADE